MSVVAWPAFANRSEQPYNWLLYTALQRLGVRVREHHEITTLAAAPDIIHLHWSPTSRSRGGSPAMAAARSAGLLGLLDSLRMRGTRVVWTAHNIAAHDRKPHPRIEEWFWRAFPRRLDAIISMSESAARELHARRPTLAHVPTHVIPHGHYREAYPMQLDREAARRQLGIAPHARVVTYVGQIRRYKNVPTLTAAFRGIHDEDAVLLIAGQCKADHESLRQAAEEDSRIRLIDRFIPDHELQIYLRAADLVALPYREILNSGTALLALSFDRPILVPSAGALVDLAREIGSEWVFTYDAALMSDVLSGAVARARAIPPDARPPLESRDWNSIARQTLALYQSLSAAPTTTLVNRPDPPR